MSKAMLILAKAIQLGASYVIEQLEAEQKEISKRISKNNFENSERKYDLWTRKEEKILLEAASESTPASERNYKAIAKKLPHRTIQQIRCKGTNLGIKRNIEEGVLYVR